MTSKPEKKFVGILRSEIGNDPFDGNEEFTERSFCCAATALGSESRASDSSKSDWRLKVGRLDEVAVEDAETADAGASEK